MPMRKFNGNSGRAIEKETNLRVSNLQILLTWQNRESR